MSVKNPNKNDEVVYRTPEEIIADIDTETRPLLAEGKEKIHQLYTERIALYRKYADYEVGAGKKWSEILPEILAILEGMGI